VRRICVYAGSNPGARPEYAEGAAALATLMAERGIGLVYGGGRLGLMGVLADTVLAAGGEAIGVIPGRLLDRELASLARERTLVIATHEPARAPFATQRLALA
jgi:uncharacterized protein (TIGR00730 family)